MFSRVTLEDGRVVGRHPQCEAHTADNGLWCRRHDVVGPNPTGTKCPRISQETREGNAASARAANPELFVKSDAIHARVMREYERLGKLPDYTGD